MSTNANITVGGKEYGIRGDGYPDTVGPFLEDVIKKAKNKAEYHRFPFIKMCQMLIEDEITDLDTWIFRGSMDYSSYEYTITDEGKVLVKKPKEEDYVSIEKMRERDEKE